MIAHDAIILALLVAAAVTSVVELGLSAWLVSGFHDLSGYYYDPYSGYSDTYDVSVPGQLSFLVFDSIWGILATAFLIVVAFFLPKKFQSASGKALGITTLVITTLTMLLWLAGFAALAALYGGVAPDGLLGALLAFAVIPWLIFVALTILNFLTAFGVLKSERRGWGRLSGHATSNQYGGVAQPMSYETAPMHMQPPQQQQYQQYQQPHQQAYQQPQQQPYQAPYQQPYQEQQVPLYQSEQVYHQVDKA